MADPSSDTDDSVSPAGTTVLKLFEPSDAVVAHPVSMCVHKADGRAALWASVELWPLCLNTTL